MTRPDWAPADVDIDRPNVARMYDYYLGGSHNLGVDREVAEQAIAVMPDLPRIANANRAFLRRAVTYCIDQGVRQFLDIGSGIPTVGNVHEIAQRADPQARVAYVDTDPVAIAHAQAILAGNDRATAIQEDLRRPESILDQPDVRRVLDFEQPVAILLVMVLHFVPDADDPTALVRRLVEAAAAGSHLVITHGLTEIEPEQQITGTETERGGAVLNLYRLTRNPLTPRTRAAVKRFFDGLEMVDPGFVWAPQWRPDTPLNAGDDGGWTWTLACVGRKA